MTTLRTILCPIDFSDHSRQALQWAAALASRHQSRLIVLSAVDPLLAEAAKVRLGLDLAATEVEPALREFVGAISRSETRGSDVVFYVRVGHPADVILDAATDGVDLIVMGTHGLGGFRKWLLGSTTQRVPLQQLHVKPATWHCSRCSDTGTRCPQAATSWASTSLENSFSKTGVATARK